MQTARDLRELLADAPSVDAELTGDPDDPTVSLAWLLRMAARTLHASPSDESSATLAALEDTLSARPAADEALGQLAIDAPSCLRRARLVRRDGPVLAVGDDDGVTLALLELGHPEVCAVDLDKRLLDFLGARGVETHRANFLEEAVPAPLRGRFASVVTDPFRDLDGGLGFLCFAAACVREGGALFWVDDADWNPDHQRVRDAMAALGWRVVESHTNVHAYPLDEVSFEPSRIIDALDVDEVWLRRVIRATSAWSGLHRLER